jgi:hypothetical protein
VSSTGDIAKFFARLGIDPGALSPIDARPNPESPWFRSVGTEFAYRSTIGPIATSLGLDGVSVDWSPFDGKAQAIWIAYWRPEGFDVRSLFSSLGRPDTVLMDYAGGGAYRTVLTYTSKGALVRMDATPQEWPRLCLTHRELEDMEIVLLPSARDPLDFTEWITDIPGYLGDQNEFTGLSLEEYLDLLSAPNGCVTLRK